MFTRGNRLLQPLPKWGEGDRLTQAPGTIAIFCKPICGLARGKHHRFQMSKSFPGQGGGKENPKPGTVATAEARSGFQCCLCLTVLRRGDDRQITLQWGGGGLLGPSSPWKVTTESDPEHLERIHRQWSFGLSQSEHSRPNRLPRHGYV